MTAPPQIFEGIRVIDFTQFLAGPVAGRLFVDLGAEVIKVEMPPVGEQNRLARFSRTDGADGVPGLYFALHNRGKKSICVDCKRTDGAAVIRDLARKCDVFIENYTPGVLDRYGLAYDDIAKVNPAIVMCSISTYGRSSPYAARIGNDAVGLSVGGVIHMMGEPDGYPAYPASAIGDHMTALNAFGAVSAALFHRQRTGEGQFIDIALIDCAYNSHDWALAAFSATGETFDPQRGGTQRTGAFPYGVFKSKEGYVCIGVFTDRQWAALARGIGREDLLELPELRGVAGRLQNQEALQKIIEEWLQSRPSDDDAVRILADELRLPAGRVLSVGQFTRDPSLSDRMVERVTLPNGRSALMLKSPHKFSKTPPLPPGTAPLLGEHTTAVLKSLCGYSDEKISALLDDGIAIQHRAP